MNIRYPDVISVFTENDCYSVSGKGYISKEDVSVSAALVEKTLNICLVADQTPVRYIKLHWTFGKNEKRNDSVKVYGDVWERGYGDLEWRGNAPDRMMPWVCAVSNGSDSDRNYEGRFTECFGVKTQPNAMCFWQYDTSGITLWLDVRCGGCGVILEGRKLSVCEVLFSEYRNISAFDALRKYYKSLCQNKLSADRKIYGSNNWYYAYGKTSHSDVIDDTELIVKLCSENENKPYMVIDDGWEKNGCDAPWDVLKDGKFYDMQELAKEISQKGARPGIWLRPLSDRKFEVFNANAEQRSGKDSKFLDPSHPDVLEYVRKTIEMICGWGYELIKHDFTTYDALGFWGFERKENFADDGWHFWNRKKTTAEIFIDLYKVIYEASKNKAVILGCNVIGHLAAGLVHANRTGDDTSGYDWERVRKYGVNTLAFRMLHHGAFYEGDVDCVGIMGKIDWQLNHEWLKAVSRSGTAMFVSPNPRIISTEEKEELREAYKFGAAQKDVLIPLDWMENICPEKWELNGTEITFNWYPKDGINSFRPVNRRKQ